MLPPLATSAAIRVFSSNSAILTFSARKGQPVRSSSKKPLLSARISGTPIDRRTRQPGDLVEPGLAEIARRSLYDWFAVTRAGENEPVAKIVRGLVADEGGKEAASVAGLDKMVPARAAALANGAASHALDYDDTHFAHVGHPSVAILPAALAVAEEIDAPASAALDALLIGAEASIRIGMVLGRRHYDRGFHQTATAGAFGATVAAARVMGLTRDETRNALSLIATRASGLKSQFGSMGKPFNAGVAASNGVEAAQLAKRGFVSCDDGVGGPQGFIDAHVDEACEDAAWRRRPLRPSCSRTSSTSYTPAAMACTRQSRRCARRSG